MPNDLLHSTQNFWLVSRSWQGRRAAGDPVVTTESAINKLSAISMTVTMKQKLGGQSMMLLDDIIAGHSTRIARKG